MQFIHGHTYRFFSVAYPSLALNVYGTNAASTGRNVCLYNKDTDPDDPMQKWKFQEDAGVGKRLHSFVNGNYVLDRSSGITNSYANNAHLCATSQTSATDSELYFLPVSIEDNTYRIRLDSAANGLLYLTAANNKSGTPASSISTESQLTSAIKNVYWATAEPVGTTGYDKQCWTVVDLDATSGGNTGGNTGDDLEEYDYVINNVGLPLDDCEVGTYWTTTGNPTDAYGTDSKSYNGIQCAGFARYVYAQIWGSDSNGHQFKSNKDYLEETTGQGDLDDFPLGTRIVCTVRKSFTPGTDEFDEVRTYTHQMILVAKTPASVTFYHANWDNKCGIAIDTWTNSQFYNRFKEIKGATFIPY